MLDTNRSYFAEDAGEREDDYADLLATGDVLFQFYQGKSYVIIIGKDGMILKTWDVPNLPFGLKAGTPIPEGTVTYKTMIAKKRLSAVMPKEKSKFGFGYIGIGLPVFARNGAFRGAITITSPLYQQDVVLEISSQLKGDIHISNENKRNISGISDDINGIIGNLKGISDKIQEHVGVITDVIKLIRTVSDQTNLLGINAAIESARAGQSGRGFAVVAQEIRRLSDTVDHSIKELDGKLSTLSAVIEDINPQVASLNSLIAKQSASIGEIDSITGRLAAASDRLGALAQESWL